jgi:vanillate monooxygenase ferredoxin subunit
LLSDTLRLRVARIDAETADIRTYELVPPPRSRLPPFEAGAHLDVRVPGGQLRQYSLCNDPQETHRYVIAVQREARGRGGSLALHDHVHVDDTLLTSLPRNTFPLRPAPFSLLVAGGIGITPLLSMARQLVRTGAPFALHYCTRTPERTAFRALLCEPRFAPHVHLHHDGGDPARGLDVRALLSERPAGAQLYCCGPAPLMGAVRDAAEVGGWPQESVHFESFGGEATNVVVQRPEDGTFEVALRRSHRVLPVPPGASILNVLRANGVQVPSDCEAGSCGTCLTGLLGGEPDHRDCFLEAAQRGRNILVCVSRARSQRLELDL